MKTPIIKKQSFCRTCQKNSLTKLFSLGMTPLANAFLNKIQLDLPESYFPLDIYQCENCGLVQLGHVVSPMTLFGNYVYVSSTSIVFINHFNSYAEQVNKRFKLNKKSLVVDIGSNDGILLKPFKKLGVKILGVEPALKIALEARKNGVQTISEFFTPTLARKIVKTNGKASVITANNVFAHIDNLDEVMSGIKILLEDDGVFIIEAPYLIDFLEKNYFDLIYHEHLSYLSIKPLKMFFERFSMEIFDVQRTPVHGGSIRIFIKNKNANHKLNSSVKEHLIMENKIGLYNKETYKKFAMKISVNKSALINLLTKIKTKGAMIAGYGAPAKGNTLLNYFSIGKDFLDFVIDDSPWKQGLYTPGTHIEVVPSREIYSRKPNYILILAWNFAPSIMETHKKYYNDGGRFIIPVPKPHIVKKL